MFLPFIYNAQLFFSKEDYFYQILYTFLMLVQPSDAQNLSFLYIFWSFQIKIRKKVPKGATTSLYVRVKVNFAFEVL